MGTRCLTDGQCTCKARGPGHDWKCPVAQRILSRNGWLTYDEWAEGDCTRTAPTPRRSGHGRPSALTRMAPARIPGHLRWRIEAREPWTDNSLFDLVANCIEWGWSIQNVWWAVIQCRALHELRPGTIGPGKGPGSYHARAAAVIGWTALDAVIEASIAARKLLKLHQHTSRPCDRAGCPNAPQWLRRA